MSRLVLFLVVMVNGMMGQDSVLPRIHSHNDYLQNVPFWKAYAAGASSIEADVFLIGESLLVAHTQEEIDTMRSLERLYFEPLEEVLALGLESPKQLQLLIDIKSEPYGTLDAIIKVLQKYPSIRENDGITITISGNRPPPSEYLDYPDYIFFDYQSLDAIENPSILEKIALISLSFANFSEWNGKGRLTAGDYEKVASTVKKAQTMEKPFRFWATPDSKTAWKTFSDLGVDFINTDMPFECAKYLHTLPNRYYRNTKFSKVYRPTFTTDATDKAVEHIILMIGDGYGLAQISATALANGGELSLTQLKSIGFLKTKSADDFTTDSAGAGTAIATGQKAPNRAIGTDSTGNPLENITELLHKKGYLSGIITTDEITGATPSAFYAHREDRGMTNGIREDFFNSRLSVFVSSGDTSSLNQSNGQRTKEHNKAVNKINRSDFELLGSIDDVPNSKKNRIGVFFNEDMPIGSMKTSESTNIVTQPKPLFTAVEKVLQFLEKKEKPFFLLVEGAKIDSYGHVNDIGGIVREGIAFDRAVTEALKFADSHNNTLVIITADHETGGLTLPQGNLAKSEIEGDFTTDDHTGMLVPVFAYGPQSKEFQGVYENNELFHKMLKVLEVSGQK